MIENTTLEPAPPAERAPVSPIVWGLTVRELHDAHWIGRGVQCVRRGDLQSLARAAELYLLIEPRQLVLFDLAALTDRLIWRKATVTRLRVLDQDRDAYDERVEVDEHGLVRRIERRYRPHVHGTWRVILTRKRRIARAWMAASSPREGWRKIRRMVDWSRLDHVRWPGASFEEGRADRESDLIARLVAGWPDPAQAIDGIEEAAVGVWTLAGETPAEGANLCGPLWLGRGGALEANGCLIGPGWIADQAGDEAEAGGGAKVRAGVRRIGEIELTDAPGRGERPLPTDPGAGYQSAKRMFDVVVSATALIFLLPVFAIIALCILLEDGPPVLYGHRRQTRGGATFRCWKFRTMRRNAEKLTPELAGMNICDGPQVYIKDDPRVTCVGHILRRFHLDELPQAWNVLFGQMSMVGPRPSPDEENQYCPAWRDQRLSVRPGVTGLWQLERTRAPGKDFQEWIRYDIEYVRRASFWFDLKLLVKTIWMVIRKVLATGAGQRVLDEPDESSRPTQPVNNRDGR